MVAGVTRMVDMATYQIAEGENPRPRELAMSAAWNGALLRSVTTSDGDAIDVIFHGTWSHGHGPDFQNAILTSPQRGYQRGAVEIHTRTSDWYRHGHHTDPAYNDVILHIVSIDDDEPVRTAGGSHIPTARLTIEDTVLFAIDRNLPDIWDRIGGNVCAATLATEAPREIVHIIHGLGDNRLQDRATRYAALLSEHDANAIIIEGVFDALGYSENRTPMRRVAEVITRYHLMDDPRLLTSPTPPAWLGAALLGIGGFLPLAPRDAHAAGVLPNDQYLIERWWAESAPAFSHDQLSPTDWTTARVRPANHPAYRLMQGAAFLHATIGNPAAMITDLIRSGEDPVSWLQESTSRPGHPGLGAGRATAATASVLLPFVLATAEEDRDGILEDAARRCWAELKHKEWTRPAKRAMRQVTGGPSLRGLGERGHQGLIELDRNYCTPRHCHHCPIARAVVSAALQPAKRPTTPSSRHRP